ncbi:MAG: PQQ-binding-like beta-propeller repeat protein [Gammaproteobacteria bacterium]|jgi:alcohol dehydrogenase (cytochrome c)|nr:PQQ-binding-like beta-propeller repeat protein [Gammaproteobacteria bacterium]MBT3859101.1 PQQ-binding-like beta-propeller repeat protein [Gammaproteobacteria bacterium]MBT3987101.1 PQQ-binding-like beta-propeller repeat protein [Gammaproteobacteria bacterium]MBT4580520.1 PQQ-binding-like beta-propeller repeat protein [Gammaproteobacteria bacterium]MBT4658569.1 PQQ-binding-like beta-propeller repeat protein [Gammaproteobacteria bacterium]
MNCSSLHRVNKFYHFLMACMLFIFSTMAFSQLSDIAPVTDDTLNNPLPGDWLSWRGNTASWGYSSLSQINTDNVDQLQLVWSWAMDDTGAGEAAPLVHDGVMFIPAPRGVIQALNAATGDLIWEYRPGITEALEGSIAAAVPAEERVQSVMAATAYAGVGRGVQKNIAIYGDKIYAATENASIVAIDIRTGRLVWETQTANPELGYFYVAGPIIADGKLITGISGCGRYKEDVCFITGHDSESGEELWRTSTVARPGEPGGDTWDDLPLRFRAGSDAWIAGSYDPKTNLIYWGTAQAKPWARAVRGTDADALYTNSTLALNPDTGEMIWYYQHLPGETQDMDEVFENILVDIDGRQSLFKMGKLGILWELDRVSGEVIKATDIGYQNIVNVDPVTGSVRYRDGMIPRIGEQIDMCPSTSGFKSWRAMAYSPQTSAMYIPITLNCELATFGPTERELGGGGTGPVRRINYPHPDAGDNLGELLVLDIPSGEVKWRFRSRAPVNTAALTTGGGLVFFGDWDRKMYALDAENGEVLWQTRVTTSAQGFPISYEVDGRQYIALPSGTSGASWAASLPRQLASELKRPRNGNAMHVFALPEK